MCTCKSHDHYDDGSSFDCMECHSTCYSCTGPNAEDCIACYDNVEAPRVRTKNETSGMCEC